MLYCLKPIAYDELAGEITRAIKAEQAALEAEKMRTVRRFTRTGVIQKRTGRIFSGPEYVLNEDYYRDTGEMWEDAAKLDVRYDAEDMFVPFAFRLHNYDHVLKELGRGMLEWTFKNIADEVFDTPSTSIQGFGRIQAMEWAAIIQQNGAWPGMRFMAAPRNSAMRSAHILNVISAVLWGIPPLLTESVPAGRMFPRSFSISVVAGQSRFYVGREKD